MTGYAASLDALWAAHLAPRSDDAPTAVSAFSGAGGTSLGLSASGYRELLAIEWDARACQVFRANFPAIPVYEGDITALDPRSLTLPSGGLDLLAASPPCQGVSMTGLRREADPRNQLLARGDPARGRLAARAIVIENVPGLVRGAMRAIFRQICAALRELGYQVEARLVDASQLGVPQARVRVFIVAVRCDLATAPAFPAPRTRPVTVREAWKGRAIPGFSTSPRGRRRAGAADRARPERADALRRRGGKPLTSRPCAWTSASPRTRWSER